MIKSIFSFADLQHSYIYIYKIGVGSVLIEIPEKNRHHTSFATTYTFPHLMRGRKRLTLAALGYWSDPPVTSGNLCWAKIPFKRTNYTYRVFICNNGLWRVQEKKELSPFFHFVIFCQYMKLCNWPNISHYCKWGKTSWVILYFSFEKIAVQGKKGLRPYDTGKKQA